MGKVLENFTQNKVCEGKTIPKKGNKHQKEVSMSITVRNNRYKNLKMKGLKKLLKINSVIQFNFTLNNISTLY